MGETVGIDDLSDINPVLLNGFRQLLAYDADDFNEVFDHNFTVAKESLSFCGSFYE
jgi:hypothetical protein